MNSGSDSTASQAVTIRGFKNPIKTGRSTGFVIQSQTEDGYVIGVSPVLSLQGTSIPTDFQRIEFSFDDTSRVGEYSAFKINIEMKVPTEKNCFFKVKFPDSFAVDQQMIGLYGTQLFQPLNFG